MFKVSEFIDKFTKHYKNSEERAKASKDYFRQLSEYGTELLKSTGHRGYVNVYPDDGSIVISVLMKFNRSKPDDYAYIDTVEFHEYFYFGVNEKTIEKMILKAVDKRFER